MAVPKKKKSSSKSGMRRGSNGTLKADFPNVIVDKESGDFKLSHHVVKDTYGKLSIFLRKKAKKNQDSESKTEENNIKNNAIKENQLEE
jgi:ribosomal protein L32